MISFKNVFLLRNRIETLMKATYMSKDQQDHLLTLSQLKKATGIMK